MPSLWRRSTTLLRAICRADPKRYVTLVLRSAANYLLPLLAALFVRDLINSAVHGKGTRALVFAGLVGAATALAFTVQRLSARHTMWLLDASTAWFEGEMMRLSSQIPDISHLENPEYLDKLEQLRYEPRTLGTNGVSLTTSLVGIVCQSVFLSVLLVSVNPILLFLLPVAGLSMWINRRGRIDLDRAFAASAEDRRVANHFFELATSPSKAEEVRTQRIGHELIARHDERLLAADQLQHDAERRSGLLQTLSALLFSAAYLGAIVYVTEEGIRGRVSLGEVVLTVILAGIISQQMIAFMQIFVVLGTGLRAVGKFLWLVDYASEHAQTAGSTSPPDRLVNSIELEEVSFRYPGTDRDVLSGLNLEFPAGSVIAIVGDNGAGKTTLVKLLTGMYQPTGGRITVDGTPLTEIDLESWRSRCAAAFQDFARFELVAQQSIGVGDLAFVDDRDRVSVALNRAGVGEFPDVLDAGLDTPLGVSLENESQLSGGQWQKVALGRSVMRLSPLLLVFDEPTASLDPDAEHALFVRWARRAREGATHQGSITVLVSHRFSTVRIADFIVVLSDQGIAEVGSHAQLLQQRGLYAELYELQATGYR